MPRRTVDTKKLLQRSLEARSSRRARRRERAAAEAVPAALAMTARADAPGRSNGSPAGAPMPCPPSPLLLGTTRGAARPDLADRDLRGRAGASAAPAAAAASATPTAAVPAAAARRRPAPRAGQRLPPATTTRRSSSTPPSSSDRAGRLPAGRSMRASQRPGASTSGGLGSIALALPQPGQALLAGPLDDAVDEGGAAVVGGLGELEPEQPLDEAVGLGRSRPGAGAAPRSACRSCR